MFRQHIDGMERGDGEKRQCTHGLLSTSEWTGVLFSTLARAVNLDSQADWVLAEGADAAVMTRSIPMDKLMRDGMIVSGQNGEALRPEQGHPLRLLLPGYEGNTHNKWLRRLQVSDKPFMTREETSKYTDLYSDGRAKLFTLEMEPKVVITFPSGEMKLPKPGHYQISNFAWTGRGRVQAVDISPDGGKTWAPARLENTPEPQCTVRFSFVQTVPSSSLIAGLMSEGVSINFGCRRNPWRQNTSLIRSIPCMGSNSG